MGANHLDNIVITLTLAAAPAPQAGFGRDLILVDEAAGNTLNGDRTRIYSDVDGAQADQTAGYITAAVVSAVTTAFSQIPRPQDVMVGRVNTGGAETYSAGLTACIADNPDFYGVTIDSRADANILLIAADVEAQRRMFFLQSDDADWLTTGLPGTLTALAGKERSVICYHDDDTEWMDVGWSAGWLAFDPDTDSAPGHREVKGVASYSPLPTDTQKAFLDANNANHGLPYGPAVFFVDPGVNANGRPIYEILTADWFEARLQEDVATLVVNASARGEKIVVDDTGGALVLSLIKKRLAIAIAAGHLVAGSATQLPITTADRDAQRIRFSVQGQFAVSGRVFTFTVNLSRDPIT